MRVLAVSAGKRGVRECFSPVNPTKIISRQVEAAVSAAQSREMLDIDLADSESVGILAFSEKLTVLRDKAETGIAVVRRALAAAGRGKHNTALETAGERADLARSLGFGRDSFGEGRHLGDDGRALERIGNGGGEDLIPVGAELDRDAQIAERIVAEQRVGAEDRLQFADSDKFTFTLICGKEGSFDIFARDKPEQLAVKDHGCDAQQTGAVSIGKPHKDEHILAFAGTNDLFERVGSAVQDDTMRDEVAAGDAGERELGKDENFDTGPVCVFDRIDNTCGVVIAVGYPDHGRCRRNFYKSILHLLSASLRTGSARRYSF